jgi:thioredoxin 1
LDQTYIAVENMDSNQDKPPTVRVGDTDFEAEVLQCHQPVLVAFWAPWSRPCRILERALHEVAIACAGRAKVVKVNADDYPDLSLLYEIQSIPTLLFFVGGALHAKVVGTTSREAILARLQAVIDGGAAASSPAGASS